MAVPRRKPTHGQTAENAKRALRALRLSLVCVPVAVTGARNTNVNMGVVKTRLAAGVAGRKAMATTTVIPLWKGLWMRVKQIINHGAYAPFLGLLSGPNLSPPTI